MAGRLPAAAPTILYRVHPDGYAGLYDVRGLQRGTTEDRTFAALEQILADTSVRPLPDQLHAVWYLIAWHGEGRSSTKPACRAWTPMTSAVRSWHGCCRS